MSCTLWNNIKYKSFIDCLVDTPITVYDIKAANISVLFDKGLISPEVYNNLRTSAKIEREIYIGNLQGRNPYISEKLKEGIIEAKEKFFTMNGLDDSEILEIDNDAVYVIGSRPIRVQSVCEHVYFKKAEQYTSFYRVRNIEYFYYANIANRVEYLNPKGLGNKAIALHEPFMLDFLKELFYRAQFEGPQSALQVLASFHQSYCSRRLPLGYYRNLNPDSKYAVGNFDRYATYAVNNEDPRLRRIMDISYNEKILREFNMLLSERYLKFK